MQVYYYALAEQSMESIPYKKMANAKQWWWYYSLRDDTIHYVILGDDTIHYVRAREAKKVF